MFSIERNRNKAKKVSGSGKVFNSEQYPHRLSLYIYPPIEEMRLDQFEEFGWERLNLLKKMEQTRLKHAKADDQQLILKKIENQYIPLDSIGNDEEKLYEQRRKDHISHFILRLAFCKTEAQRRWFLGQECELFRWRLKREDINEFLTNNNLQYQRVTQEEKRIRSKELLSASKKLNRDTLESTEYFKIPFEQATELVRQRRVYLEKGVAYVQKQDLISIIVAEFRLDLSKSLTIASKGLPQLEEDDRIIPYLNAIGTCETSEYKPKAATEMGQITPEDLDSAQEYFPMCMSNLHKNLRKHHHLRHWGRFQYRLFLKAIGLTLEDSLRFWRKEFSKVVPLKQVESEHMYGIRHTYGKEGVNKNYSSFGCHKLITTNAPGSGDHHGCPFKHFDANNLKNSMQQKKIPKHQIDEMIKLVKDQHYQVACTKYFEAIHKTEMPMLTISHPVQFYQESIQLRGGTTVPAVGNKNSAGSNNNNNAGNYNNGANNNNHNNSNNNNFTQESMDFDDGDFDSAMLEMDIPV